MVRLPYNKLFKSLNMVLGRHIGQIVPCEEERTFKRFLEAVWAIHSSKTNWAISDPVWWKTKWNLESLLSSLKCRSFQVISKLRPLFVGRNLSIILPSCKSGSRAIFHHNLKPTEFNRPLFCIHPLPSPPPDKPVLFPCCLPIPSSVKRTVPGSFLKGGSGASPAALAYSRSQDPAEVVRLSLPQTGSCRFGSGGLCEPLSQTELHPHCAADEVGPAPDRRVKSQSPQHHAVWVVYSLVGTMSAVSI